MNVLYFYLFLLIHPYLAQWWRSFERANRKPWEALVPGYNYFVAYKISCQKPWWSLLLIFPGVHLVMWSVVNTSYIRKFGYYSLVDTLQGVFFPYLVMAKIANSQLETQPETNWASSKEIGQREWGDHLVLFLCLPVIGHAFALSIAAVTRPKPGKKTRVKEWGDSILFALVAASVIRTYVFEPFQIPTGSMEKTLLVGDFLFVNKLAYGPKVPVTPLSYPLVHNTIPWVNIKSYTGLERSNYTRLPGFADVQRNEVVVFNYPSGDTAVYDPRMPNGLMGHDYHGIVIKEAIRMWQAENKYTTRIQSQLKDSILKMNPQGSINMIELDRWSFSEAQRRVWNLNGEEFIENLDKWKEKARKMLAEDKIAYDEYGQVIKHYGLVYRPVDKRENYIKRCVGVPGDWLEIKDAILYVNNKPAYIAPFQNVFYLTKNFTPPGVEYMYERYGVEAESDYRYEGDGNGGQRLVGIHANLETIKKLRRDFKEAEFIKYSEPQYADSANYKPGVQEMVANLSYFPKDPKINNTVTDFTRFQIPSKGQRIEINKENIAWYRRIITSYEGHQLEEKKDGIYIDGKKVSHYTFSLNYYWMMGDNRNNSADSRMWGFVPEDHIVGKASMVWFSKSPYRGIRWERVFMMIR